MPAGHAALVALAIADPPARWRALGFAVGDDGRLALGAIEVTLGASGRGIVAWTVTGASAVDAVLGLPTGQSRASQGQGRLDDGRPVPAPTDHANRATGLDHVVVTVPEFDATAAALEAAGLPFRRIRRVSDTVRQGFRRLGPAILEVVEAPGTRAPAFWGLVVIVPDLEALAQVAAPHVKPPRGAVQPGRRIAPVSSSAGLSTQLAFMDPEPA